jgi:hypothetical protein
MRRLLCLLYLQLPATTSFMIVPHSPALDRPSRIPFPLSICTARTQLTTSNSPALSLPYSTSTSTPKPIALDLTRMIIPSTRADYYHPELCEPTSEGRRGITFFKVRFRGERGWGGRRAEAGGVPAPQSDGIHRARVHGSATTFRSIRFSLSHSHSWQRQ